MIAKQQWNKLLQLVAILTICNCQGYHIKPDNCLQEECCSYPPPDCMTLSEYVLNDNNYNNLILSPGEYYLNSTISINGTSTNTQDFSIIGSGSETTSIICTQNSTLEAFLLDTLTIENVSFVSCGVDTTPGVSLNNIGTVSLTDTSFSNSTSGALDTYGCYYIHLTRLKIINNINSQHTIVSVKNSTNIVLNDLLVANNSIGKLDSSCTTYTSFLLANEVIFRIEVNSIVSNNMQVSNNIGPFGVIVFEGIEVTASGDWIFERNQVCKGGSLALVHSNVYFNGSLIFNENKGMDITIEETAGLFLQSSSFILFGLVEFTGNEGYIACYVSIAAKLSISKGALIIQNSSNASFQAMSLQRESVLQINDILIIKDNQCLQRTVLSESSEISLSKTGVMIVTNNYKSPFSVYNTKVTLNGTLNFFNNAGILYASKSDVVMRGTSTFVRSNIEDRYSDGALSIIESTLLMDGTYTFRDCHYDDPNGGGIFASVTATITLGGTGYFINNTANNGGGIYIEQVSRLKLNKGARLYFWNNTAIKGAAMFIGTSIEYIQCSSSETDCFFELEDSNDHNVSIQFKHNKAYPGASVTHVNFDHIEESKEGYTALNNLNRTIDMSSFIGNSNPHYVSDSYWFCFCKDNFRENCIRDDPPANITAFKGKPFSVKARVLKFYGAEMSEPVRASLESSLNAVDRDSIPNSTLSSNDGKLQSASATECSNFTFSIKSTSENETIVMNVGETFLGIEKSLKVNVRFNPFCPPGFPLNKEGNSCECDESIKNFLRSCVITDEMFSKRTEYTSHWMAPSKDSRFKQGAMSWYSNCPNRYCITDGEFTFSEDGICANNRTGLLCGECKVNYSLLLGGDLCDKCSNAYLALILVFCCCWSAFNCFHFPNSNHSDNWNY